MPGLDKIWKTSDLGPSGVGKQVQALKWDGKWSGAGGVSWEA